jgi:mono/diheme cytochrome c family protein
MIFYRSIIKVCSIVFLLMIPTRWVCSQELNSELAKTGEVIYAKNCATCHGNRMKNPQWGIDLSKFPQEQKIRFMDSVTYGKNAMPPWEDVLSTSEIEALWAYLLSVLNPK